MDKTPRNFAVGSAHGRAKLNEEQVIAIRSSSKSVVALAYEHNVSITTIANIKRNRVWKHLL